MKPVSAKGKGFQQGSDGPWAQAIERPVFASRFSYDFQLDSAEVTQGSYAALMGANPVPASSPYGQGDAFPVYNVSWFDAALYCNARSKASGYDTVYRYSRVDRAGGGNVYALGNLEVRLDLKGFRLPTEAEWEYAAKAGQASAFAWGGLPDSALARQFAWYEGNAGGKTHPVAGLKPNAFGLYDMAGNVMEWVNDWKGPYPSSGSQDFAGARDPGPEFDTPIKGGAFKYGMRELRPSNRSVTYTTIRSATAEYVGFRCALGAILKPGYSTGDGTLAATDPVRLEVTRLQNLVEGRPAKLVFVNATQSVRHLAYVDYRRSPPRLFEFGDIGNVFYPVISPDGEWVAFGTAVEGSGSGSSLYVRRLGDSAPPARLIGPGFIPRWWVDPAAKDTGLVYTTSASDNSQGQWASSQTLLQRMSGGSPAGAPTTVVAEGGFHDGRSKDGRWLATGFRLLKVRDGQSGAVRVLFTAPQNGKAAGDTSQVCNVSIAPDSTGRMLFLDFGYDGISQVTGSFYDIHQVAFLGNPEGQVLRWFRAPRSEKGWEDLEWSNQADYAVSASTDEAGGHHRLYLLDLKDSVYTLLASGTQLATPGLWLGGEPDSIPTDGLDLDSLGRYDEPPTNAYQSVFATRMAYFWNLHTGLEVAITGSSHAYDGINPNMMTHFRAFNMGFPAFGWLGQEEWATRYPLNHCPKLKALVMEAFPGWLYYPDGDYTWKDQLSQSKGLKYDESHGYWKEGLPFGFEGLVRRVTYLDPEYGDTLGYRFFASRGWGKDTIVREPSADWGLDDIHYQATMKRIEDFAKRVSERRIHLVLVNYPTMPGFKGTGYYGCYGPRDPVAAEILKRFKDMEKISPYVHFYDAYNFGDHDYTDDDAYDWGHLSSNGAAKLTSRLDSLIRTLP
jgi:uncharacterized protein (TIGR02171 family)